jgi:hypothetical protein
MDKDEALKLALEALEAALSDDQPYIDKSQEAITALKQARSAPVQEPTAKVAEVHMSRYTLEWTNGPLSEGTELFDRPAAQRQWVGLTDEERVDLWKATETDNRMVLIDAIEAKLKERNV